MLKLEVTQAFKAFGSGNKHLKLILKLNHSLLTGSIRINKNHCIYSKAHQNRCCVNFPKQLCFVSQLLLCFHRKSNFFSSFFFFFPLQKERDGDVQNGKLWSNFEFLINLFMLRESFWLYAMAFGCSSSAFGSFIEAQNYLGWKGLYSYLSSC